MLQLRIYDLKKETENLFTNEIVNLLSKIHEYKGKQTLYIEANPDILTNLLDIAKIQSTEFSNKIEGIETTDQRINELIHEKVTPKNQNEEEIAGYRDVLELIHENHDHIEISPNVMLQLHKNLYKYSAKGIGGRFKNSDNAIEEIDELGNRRIRFKPISAFETPEAIHQLCLSYTREILKEEIDPLLLIPIFILDFLSIHPFNDGNGHMSRLLTLLLLYKSGYIVGKYISIEKIIENTKESYYDTLRKSSIGWHENFNNYQPFVEYYLGIILSAYKDFSDRVEYITNKKLTVKERTETIIKNHLGKISKSEIVNLCPDISEGSIERALGQLLKEEKILKITGGRYTKYVYHEENRLYLKADF